MEKYKRGSSYYSRTNYSYQVGGYRRRIFQNPWDLYREGLTEEKKGDIEAGKGL